MKFRHIAIFVLSPAILWSTAIHPLSAAEIRDRRGGIVFSSDTATSDRELVEEALHAGKSLAGAVLDGAELGGANLAGIDLTGASLVDAKLSGADLSGALLRGARLERAIFSEVVENVIMPAGANPEGVRHIKANLANANLQAANLRLATLAGVDLSGASLEDASLEGASLLNATLSEANLSRASLRGANLKGAVFFQANLEDSMLAGAILASSTLDEANLSRADLTSADLNDAQLNSTKFECADLTSAKLYNAEALRPDFSGAILDSTDLSKAVLLAAQFPNASLTYATLNNTTLSQSNLRGAWMENASFKDAILLDADLRGANLRNVELSGADLSKARLEAAYLKGAKLDGNTRLQSVDLDGAVVETSPLPGANQIEDAKHLDNVCFAGVRWSDWYQVKAALESVPSFQPARQVIAALHRNEFIRECSVPARVSPCEFRRHSTDQALGQMPKADTTTASEGKSTGTSGSPSTYETESRMPATNMARASEDEGTGWFTWMIRQLFEERPYYTARALKYVMFDLTVEYGANTRRPFVLVFLLALTCALAYWIFLRFCWPSSRRAILLLIKRRSRAHSRLLDDLTSHGTWLQVALPIRPLARGLRQMPLRSQGRGTQRWRFETHVLLVAALFSLYSLGSIGFRDINITRWMRSAQLREFDIQALGWPRLLSGLQGLVSIYLIALGILCAFGNPFHV